jgi:hypothetical protein
VRGTHEDAVQLLNKIISFCKSIGLTVSEEKTKITNLGKEKAYFLGVELSRSRTMKFTKVGSSSFTKRLGLRIRMTAPLLKIMKKLTLTGFIVKGVPSPRFL